MSLNARNKEYTRNDSDRPEPLDAGAYPGRVVQVIDLGVQEQNPYKGEAKPPAQEIMVTYELVDEFMKDKETGEDIEDKPRWISENFVLHPLASDLAKSTKRYYAIDPKETMKGDWTKLLGFPVLVNITASPGKGKNEGKVFNNVVSTSSMRPKEAEKLPELKNPGKVFEIDNLDTIDILMTLPTWLQDKIKSGLEFEGTPMAKAVKNYKKDDANGEQKGVKKKREAEPEQEEDDDAPFDTDEEENW